jgi:hypothetical protein
MGMIMRIVGRTLVALGGILVAASLLSAPAAAEVQSAPASVGVVDSSCGDGTVCFWSSANYTGSKNWLGTGSAGGWAYAGFPVLSAKSRFGNRAVVFGTDPGVRTRCLNPGSSFEGPFPASVDWVYVSPAGYRC